MYAIYKQTHPPTDIEHCVYCQIFSPAKKRSCCGGDITASYLQVLYPRRGKKRGLKFLYYWKYLALLLGVDIDTLLSESEIP